MKQTLEQLRATHAHAAVEAFVTRFGVSSADAKKYGTHVRKLPMRIIASGLGQALAFLLAKNYCPELLKALGHWVLQRKAYPADAGQLGTADALLINVIQGDSEQMRIHTGEALAYLQWLSRFAEAKKLTVDPAGDTP